MTKKHLVIVESPAKAKTIEKFLGADYQVKSSFGHIRDLPKKGMSVDIEHNFEPHYDVSADKKKVVAELRKAAKDSELVWLASDEDREGEAIAWHLSEALKLDPKKTKRIVFHEITKPAITQAINNPRTIDTGLVNAQQARRILDRIVGYELSPVLWKKVRPGLSAGRVQSVTVRLVVEREREITSFEAENTYKVTAEFKLSDGTLLKAELPKKLSNKEAAKRLLELFAISQFNVSGVEKSPSTRNPSPPFTTSTLQQEASRRLGYSPKQTMMLAQRLYEAGHITYMRTDSLNLSKIAVAQMAEFIKSTYGDKYHNARTFTTKTAGAQEAHEAIRPTESSKLTAGNDDQQKKLYQLIRRRTLASQMAAAKLERTTVSIAADKTPEILQAKGEIIIFDGFLKLDEQKNSGDDTLLPPLSNGDKLLLQSAQAEEILSRPPARYTEASLVRKLEEMGIGRPSTYAPTISTVQDRGYVIKGEVIGDEKPLWRLETAPGKTVSEKQEIVLVGSDRGKMLPTDTGNVVTDFLMAHFPDIVDYDFTKDVEARFDHIASGKQQWQKTLEEFYKPFHETITRSEGVTRAEATQQRVLGTDPASGRPVSVRYGRFGPMAQIGESTDEEKPIFAGLTEGLNIETITLDEALKLFSLPRSLGKGSDGQEITASIGRFGPYVKVGSSFVSIKGHDPHTITLSEATTLITEHQKKQSERTIKQFDGSPVQVLNGRFGPYITNGKKNAKIPKDVEPSSLTLEACEKLLASAVTPKKRFIRRTKKA